MAVLETRGNPNKIKAGVRSCSPKPMSSALRGSCRSDRAAFLKGLTARYLLKEVLELRPGDTVLYHAAAGGVGQIFVRWAKALGLKVIGTVSSDAKAKLARHAGCDHVINDSSEDFVAEVLAFTGGNGVAAVFDSVGADTFRGSLAVLRPRGTLVQFGMASGSRWTHSSWHHARFI
jgi:NADPH:quinone reductase